jgi:hypothetical protein
MSGRRSLSRSGGSGRPAPPQAQLLLDQLRDERGRRVVLVSHCLLNKNTRYTGGATRPGAVTEAVEELISADYGIHLQVRLSMG